jgi:hypothetical protein
MHPKIGVKQLYLLKTIYNAIIRNSNIRSLGKQGAIKRRIHDKCH